MAAIRRLITYACNTLMILGGLAMLMMMLQICMDAGMRTIAHSSVPGTLEIVSFYYMVAVVFLPLAYIDGLVYTFAGLAMAYFTMAAFNTAVAMTNLGEFVLGVILVFTWPARWFVVAGTGLMSIVYVFSAIEEFSYAFGRATPKDPNSSSEKGH